MRLLVISPHYTTFIRDLIQAQSESIAEINVLIRYNKPAELLKYTFLSGYIDRFKDPMKKFLERRIMVCFNFQKISEPRNLLIVPETNNK